MRFVLPLALICSTSFAFAEDTSEAAQEDSPKAQSCQLQADIVSQAAEMRAGGKRERRVKRTIAKDIADEMVPAVPLLVGWVFTLPKEDLDKDPGPAYYEACLTQ